MKEKLLKLIHRNGPELAVKQLNFQDDTLRAMDTYGEVVKHLYWQDKDLPNTIALAQGGIAHGLEKADETDNDELAFELRAKAKGIAYNLASFTWPGWDEPDFEISTEQAAIGLEAAQTNLDLAVMLERDDLRHSYAHWMLAAQQLAAGEHAAAKASFQSAAEFGKQAKRPSAELLGTGFAALVDLLGSPGDAGLGAALDGIKDQLGTIEHGADYIKQIETAWKVFQAA